MSGGRDRLGRTRRVTLGGQAREHFLAAEPIDAGRVREVILVSWWRSRRWNVVADDVEICPRP